MRYAPTRIQNPACPVPAGCWAYTGCCATGCWNVCVACNDAPHDSQNLPSGVFFLQFGQMTIVNTTFDLRQVPIPDPLQKVSLITYRNLLRNTPKNLDLNLRN